MKALKSDLIILVMIMFIVRLSGFKVVIINFRGAVLLGKVKD